MSRDEHDALQSHVCFGKWQLKPMAATYFALSHRKPTLLVTKYTYLVLRLTLSSVINTYTDAINRRSVWFPNKITVKELTFSPFFFKSF